MRRDAPATEDELVEAARRREGWFLRTGTTTVEAKSGYGLLVEDERRCARRPRLDGGGAPQVRADLPRRARGSGRVPRASRRVRRTRP